MFKKIISLVLTLSLLISLPTSAFAVTASHFVYPSGASNCFSETVAIEGKNITYYYYSIGDISYIQHHSNGQTVITERNNLSGIVQMNGKYIGTALNKFSSVTDSTIFSDDSFFSTRAQGSWRKYNTDYGDITSDVIDYASWCAAIAACLGLTVKIVIGTPALTNIIKKAVTAILPTIYYKEDMYYWNPVTTQRPKTTSCYYFYKDAGRSKRFGQYDQR